MNIIEKITKFFRNERDFIVNEIDGDFYVSYEDGTPYAGPYTREKDAKGQLTRMRNSYTPASRRVR